MKRTCEKCKNTINKFEFLHICVECGTLKCQTCYDYYGEDMTSTIYFINMRMQNFIRKARSLDSICATCFCKKNNVLLSKKHAAMVLDYLESFFEDKNECHNLILSQIYKRQGDDEYVTIKKKEPPKKRD